MKQLDAITTNFIYLFFILNTGNLYAQNKMDSEVDSIFKQYNKKAGPGCAVAILKNDSVIFKRVTV